MNLAATVHGGHKDSDMTELLSERVQTHTHTPHIVKEFKVGNNLNLRAKTSKP